MPARVICDAETADRLAKLLGMLGSSHDGEVINAGRAADQLVRSSGLTWFDIIATPKQLRAPTPEPDDDLGWRDIIAFCRAHSYRLSIRERDFIRSLERWRGYPTDKQLDWLFAIYDRMRGAA
jgi:hypothetical protein